MKLLTVEQVAKEVLATSRSTVMRLIDNGSLPAVCIKSGKRKKIWRVREDVLNKWIMARETKGKKESEPTTSTSTSNGRFNAVALDTKTSDSEKFS